MTSRVLTILGLLGSANAVSLEFRIPMRDGIQLHTVVDFPWDAVPTAGQNATAVLDRSPYGENGIERIADIFTLLSSDPIPHVAIRQDVRGTGKSEGTFGIWHDSQGDGYDTIAWIVSQPWSNGIVYTCGASADGLSELAMAAGPHPALKAQFAIFAGTTGWQIAYPGGAYRKQLVENWLNDTVKKTSPAAAIALMQANEAPGPWWNCMNGSMFYDLVTWPTVQWAGWYDIFLAPQLAAFDGFQHLSAQNARGQQRLFVDPFGHCMNGGGYFPPRSILGRSLAPILLALDLLNQANASISSEGLKHVTFYVMGAVINNNNSIAAGNFWTTMEDWPVYTPQKYYFTPTGKNVGNLSTVAAPTALAMTYLYDPANPVPTEGGNNLFGSCGPVDQRPVEAPLRTDVLTFTSAILQQPLAITGPLIADLYVSSNCTDTDFTVKLTDVLQDGSSTLVQDGIIRMRWREAPNLSLEPVLMAPGKIYHVQVSLWNTSKVFDVGHRIRVDVSSSNYPRFGANPNNGLLITQTGPTYVAQNTIWVGGEYASSFILPVVQLSQLPPIDLLQSTEQHFHAMQAAGRINKQVTWEQFTEAAAQFEGVMEKRLSVPLQ